MIADLSKQIAMMSNYRYNTAPVSTLLLGAHFLAVASFASSSESIQSPSLYYL